MMDITPEKFAKLLQNSTLDKDEQENVLKLLPHLSKEQISDIADALEDDNKELKKIMIKADSDLKQELNKLDVNLDGVMVFE